MPQKRNPDYLELVRGKTGNSIGNLISLMTTLKGLPFTYNRDLQEDREGAMNSLESVTKTIVVLKSMFLDITFNKEKMLSSSIESNILATDLADYLAFKKIPFREAYEVIKKVSKKLSDENKSIKDLKYEDFNKISDLFDEDVMKIDVSYSVEKRNSYGGTSTSSVEDQIKSAKKYLNSK